MAISRIRPLKPAEFVVLTELLLADLAADRGEDPAENLPEDDREAYLGTLTLDAIGKKARPMPVGQAIGDLSGMGCIERPKKSNEREIVGRVRITKLGEDALLRQSPTALARFREESKQVSGEGAAEVKARKAHWAEVLKRVEKAIEDLRRATAEPAADPSPAKLTA